MFPWALDFPVADPPSCVAQFALSIRILADLILPQRIRNFSIVAHVDHGKSTLADRLIERTGGLDARRMTAQVLDTLPLERERGITIKAQTVCLHHRARDGENYTLHLIDTPGHADFSYEVSRSLAACEGVLLLVDAVQGVQAQTVANAWLALEQELEIVPVVNKIDLPGADVERVVKELHEELGLGQDLVYPVSAKTGAGVEELLEGIVEHIPFPSGATEAPLRALVYDAWFDNYQGVIVNLCVKEGCVRVGDRIRFMATERDYEVAALGKFTPDAMPLQMLSTGEAGFLSAAIREIAHAHVGDTITHLRQAAPAPLPGYAPVRPMVFCGLYPASGEDPVRLRIALEKLALNDAALGFDPESSVALGLGFRCRFLGLLHMEIVQQRLEREMNLDLIATAPTVAYRVRLNNHTERLVENPAQLPEPTHIAWMEEPWIRAQLFAPASCTGSLIRLAQESRGKQIAIRHPAYGRVALEYEIPLNEVISGFYDRLKTLTRGYGSFDYEPIGFRRGDLVKLDLLLNGDPVDALSCIVPRQRAPLRGREIAERLRTHIPRQMFEVAIQAAVGSRVIARETVSALRKNVTAKCYGGDVSRKRKLLERQREGKKRMRQVGNVDVPQEAFMAVLRLDS